MIYGTFVLSVSFILNLRLIIISQVFSQSIWPPFRQIHGQSTWTPRILNPQIHKMRLHKPRQRQRQIKSTSTWILINLLRNPPRPQYESASSSFQMNVNGQWAWSPPSVPSPLLSSLQLTSDRRDACSLIHAQYRLSNGQAET